MDMNQVGLWVSAVVLIILFTLAACYGFSFLCGTSNEKGKVNKGKGKDKGGCGAIGAFLVWLIIIVIFICAVWKCGWAAIIGFIVLLIILGILCWLACASCKTKRGHGSSDTSSL